ncbi:MAG: hypothetical protein KC414_13820, partial [Romboutsia sp.]|nr:hypothetical protein [Romboutsia sp.]
MKNLSPNLMSNNKCTNKSSNSDSLSSSKMSSTTSSEGSSNMSSTTSSEISESTFTQSSTESISYEIQNGLAEDLSLLIRNTCYVSSPETFVDQIEDLCVVKSDEVTLGGFGFVNYLKAKKNLHRNMTKAIKKLTNHLEDKNGVFIFFNERFPGLPEKAIVEVFKKLKFKLEYCLIVSQVFEADKEEISRLKRKYPKLVLDKLLPNHLEQINLFGKTTKTYFSIGDIKFVLFLADKSNF